MNRRMALRQMSGLVSAIVFGSATARASRGGEDGWESQATGAANSASTAPYTLPPLPYAYDALEPYFDAETMHLHHDKHHQSYVDKLNTAVAGHPEVAGKTVYELVANLSAVPESIRNAVRNQGGGHANHSFWWTTLGKPGATPSQPSGELAKAMDAKFTSFAGFQEKLTTAATGIFGSGWAWLVTTPGGSLDIVTTPNQDSPLAMGNKPIVGIDVWEHAYYLKYKNKRPDYVKAYFSVVNWNEVSNRFAVKDKA